MSEGRSDVATTTGCKPVPRKGPGGSTPSLPIMNTTAIIREPSLQAVAPTRDVVQTGRVGVDLSKGNPQPTGLYGIRN